MARLKIKLNRNLRRNVQRGHPWIYREAITVPKDVARAQLAQVLDAKGELAWAMYDPHGPLSLRILSLDRPPPSETFWRARFADALARRRGATGQNTNAFRLFNGEGDRLPGLVCDIYNQVAVVQFDGTGPGEFWPRELIANWLIENVHVQSVIEKSRRHTEQSFKLLAGVESPSEVEMLENGARFVVNLEHGQKTGFFLDQRENREFVRHISGGMSTLNLFSYTGGFSVYAGLGGARQVASVDIAQGAVDLSDRNWTLNRLAKDQHRGICADVFAFLQDGEETWDHVLVDPPSMGHSEAQKDAAIAKYIEAFALAAKRVAPGGRLSLSSCSSHVSFEDFSALITESISLARRRATVLRVSGQGADHPFPQACPELRYLKFVHLAL